MLGVLLVVAFCVKNLRTMSGGFHICYALFVLVNDDIIVGDE